MQKRKKIAIIILSWNKKDLTLACLSSLNKTRSTYFIEIIVVDNNSSNNTVSEIKKSFPGVHIIKNSENLGWSGGNNIGARYAMRVNADVLIFLNNDIIVEKNCIDKLAKRVLSKSEIGIVGPKIYAFGSRPPIIANAGNFFTKDYWGTALGVGEKDTGQYDTIKKTDFIAGAVCIKKEVFKKIGYFDERYFLYFEDADFCLRAKQAGFICEFVQDAIQYHHGSATIGQNSPAHTYYNVRNHLLFVDKFAPFLVRFRVYIDAGKKACIFFLRPKKNRKYEWLGIRDYFSRKLGMQNYW